jgi:hypothetical protein
LRDAVELEWAGIPSVAIIHHEMTGSARAIARISGHEEYPFVTVGYPHIPTAVWTKDECREVAQAVAAEVRTLLTTPPA